MMVLYCCLLNIIHYNSTFNPNSIKFALYYCITYCQDHDTKSVVIVCRSAKMKAAPRGGGIV